MENLILFAADAGGGGRVDEIVKTFGVNWPLFISQCIAFLIVAFALKKFAYGPVLQVLEDRKQRIAESMENAEKIKTELAEAQTKKDEILSQANDDAKQLIKEAREAASKVTETENQKAIKQAEEIIAKAREASEADRDAMMAELKAEIGRLVVETTAKVSGKVGAKDVKKGSGKAAKGKKGKKGAKSKKND